MPLIPGEILQLDAALVRAFRTIRELREELPAARHIKFPPLPSILSESLVIAAAPRVFGPEWTARYGGTTCDVLIENDQGEEKRVEVKATGAHAFQELKATDLKADFLVWVRFGRRFDSGQGPIEIAILSDPSRFIPGACRGIPRDSRGASGPRTRSGPCLSIRWKPSYKTPGCPECRTDFPKLYCCTMIDEWRSPLGQVSIALRRVLPRPGDHPLSIPGQQFRL